MTEVNVHIGEIKIAKKGETLKALLGSCVGIAFLWPQKNVCGLSHCLLPINPAPSFAIDGRYVTQAIPSLLALMKIRPENYPEIHAVVAGGGNMTSPGTNNSEDLIGAVNFSVAEAEIKKLGIKLIGKDGGGEEGRKIIIFANNFTFRIDKIPRITTNK